MDINLTAVEVTGMVNERHQLQLDNPLPIAGPRRVRVIVLYPPTDELSEAEWLHAAARNSAFDFLADPQEDIYTLNDGKPFHVEI
jgi:hypothetical protein